MIVLVMVSCAGGRRDTSWVFLPFCRFLKFRLWVLFSIAGRIMAGLGSSGGQSVSNFGSGMLNLGSGGGPVGIGTVGTTQWGETSGQLVKNLGARRVSTFRSGRLNWSEGGVSDCNLSYTFASWQHGQDPGALVVEFWGWYMVVRLKVVLC